MNTGAYPCLRLGMDMDVWKCELSIFISAKNSNIDIHIRIFFNMDVKSLYPNSISSIFLYPIPDSYSKKRGIFDTIRKREE